MTAVSVEHPLVLLMSGENYDLDAFLSAHRDNGAGWCRTCGGPDSGRVRWPCTLRGAAERAHTLRARRRAG